MKKTLTVIATFLCMTAMAADENFYQQTQEQNQTQQNLPFWKPQDPAQQYEQFQQSEQTSANFELRDYLIGPKQTISWIRLDETKAPKIISDRIHMDVGGRLVNEILLRARQNPVEVKEVTVFLVDGQRLDMYQATGTLREGGVRRIDLDYRFSLRVKRIEIVATSPDLFGSRGVLVTHLGLAGY